MNEPATTPSVRAIASDLRARVWPAERAGRWFSLGVTAAVVGGLFVRVGFVLRKQAEAGLPGDAFWYHHQAKLVAAGEGFLDPFAFQVAGERLPGADHPHGFVLILALLDALGVDSPQGQRVAMCVLGAVTILVVGLLGRRLAGPLVGVIAAFIAALYPNVWINDFMLMPETPFVLGIAVSLLAGYRYLDRPNRADLLVVCAGLSLAGSARPEAVALFALFVLPMVLRRTEIPWRERVAQLAMGAVIPVLVFAPWMIYNAGRFEEPVTVSSGGGTTLAAGNCDLTYFGEHLGFYNVLCLDEPHHTRHPGDASQRDVSWREQATAYMSEHRGRLPTVVAARVGRVWHLYKPDQSLVLDGWVERRAGGPESGDQRLVRAALYSFYGLAALSIGGAVLLRRRRRPLWPLMMQPLLVTVIAAATFGVTRYRAGAELTLVLLAAVALGWLWDRVRGRAADSAGGTGPDDAGPAEDDPQPDADPHTDGDERVEEPSAVDLTAGSAAAERR